jgi:hypothetical protein
MSPDHRLRIAAPALLAVQRTVGTTGLSVSGLVGPAAVTVGPASSLACAGGSGVAADTTAGIGPVVSGTTARSLAGVNSSSSSSGSGKGSGGVIRPPKRLVGLGISSRRRKSVRGDWLPPGSASWGLSRGPAVAIVVRSAHGRTACRGHQPHHDHIEAALPRSWCAQCTVGRRVADTSRTTITTTTGAPRAADVDHGVGAGPDGGPTRGDQAVSG